MKPLVAAIHSIADSTLFDLRQNEPPVTLDFPEMTVDISKESLSQASGMMYESTHGKIKLPQFKKAEKEEYQDSCIERWVTRTKQCLYAYFGIAKSI